MRMSLQTLNFIKTNNPLKKANSLAVNNKGLRTDVFEKSAAPVSFGAISCSTKDFEIRNIENMRCPICENVMLNDEQIEKFSSLVQNKKGEKLIEALDEYGKESYWTGEELSDDKTIYRDKRKEIVNIIKEIASEHPNLELSQIVKFRAKQCSEELSKKEIEVLIELEEYVLDNVKEKREKDNLINLIGEGVGNASRVDEHGFKRKKFLYSIKDAVKNPSVQNQIDKIAQKLPTSTNDIDAFFVKYSKENRGNFEIATSLVSGAKPTAEHLVCQSDRGENFIENYLCDCAECNSSRMSTPFDEWIKGMPNIEENLQKHLDEVQGYINDGRFSHKYDFYPQGVAKTISRISNGTINLKTIDKDDPAFKKMLSKRLAYENELKDGIECMNSIIEEKQAERIRLQKEQKALEDSGDKEAAKELKTEISERRREIDAMRNRVIEVEKELKLLRNHTKKYSYNNQA